MSDWVQNRRHRESAQCVHDTVVRRDMDIIEILDSHFHWLDEQVTCSRVRPLLPGLLDPSLDLRIPTPITVHLERCPQCAKDLDSLRELSLGGEQIERLQWLYTHDPVYDSLLCARARAAIPAFVHGSWERIDGETLDHLSTCPQCRVEVYLQRQAILNELGKAQEDCGGGTASDLFDYVVPCRESVQEALQSDTSHVGTCRRCLKTIQSAHRVVYGIAERGESGVATIYSTVEGDPVPRQDDPYVGYPIRVQVTSNPRLLRIFKVSIGAAAVLLLAFLFHYTHGASGVSLAKVVRAFGRAKNVHVVKYNSHTDQVTCELWVARSWNLAGLMTAEGTVVYDLARGQKLVAGSRESVAVDEVELGNMREMADHCLGFSLEGVPSDAKWDRVDDRGDREVYTLIWTKRTQAGRGIGVKYEVTVNKSTILPELLCLSYRDSVETGWDRSSVIGLEYLTDAEMRSLLVDGPAVEAGAGR